MMPIRPPLHRPGGWQSWTVRKARAEAERPSPSRVYGWQWRKLRRAYLASYPLCACGCGHPATVVDHRVPHRGDRSLMYAWNNLEAMTKACHDRKTAARDGGFGNPIIDPGRGGRNLESS